MGIRKKATQNKHFQKEWLKKYVVFKSAFTFDIFKLSDT